MSISQPLILIPTLGLEDCGLSLLACKNFNYFSKVWGGPFLPSIHFSSETYTFGSKPVFFPYFQQNYPFPNLSCHCCFAWRWKGHVWVWDTMVYVNKELICFLILMTMTFYYIKFYLHFFALGLSYFGVWLLTMLHMHRYRFAHAHIKFMDQFLFWKYNSP